ncbi:MAG: tetratricopeptide repeat protein [Chloroflexi bacterium]|nr:tetratricopeptide repeat protein [Chloroflexota bacterium]
MGLIVALAVYVGLQDRKRSSSTRADEFYQQGEAYMEQGQYELAIVAYDEALALNPDHQRASARRAEAVELQQAAPTSTSELRDEIVESLWRDLEQAVAGSDWEQVDNLGQQIIAHDPNYRAEEVRQQLYSANLALGEQAFEEDRLEQATTCLQRALQYNPGGSQATLLQEQVYLYSEALRYTGNDWSKVIQRLSTLYREAPNLKDVAVRLRAAHLAHAQELEAEGEWCAAEEQYAAAIAMWETADVQALLAAAADKCASQAEPTPTGEAGEQVPAGTWVGRELAPEVVVGDKMFIRGRVLDARGAPVVGAQVRVQAWDFSVIAITDGTGQFSFDGLANPVVYTLTLVDLPSQPLEVETSWGRLSWVVFEQVP